MEKNVRLMSERFFYSAKVLDVLDGDTLDLLVDLGFNVHHQIRVRLNGINTPESRTKDLKEKETRVQEVLQKYDNLCSERDKELSEREPELELKYKHEKLS
jgi:endonuclease YncB( thermonuclease family)